MRKNHSHLPILTALLPRCLTTVPALLHFFHGSYSLRAKTHQSVTIFAVYQSWDTSQAGKNTKEKHRTELQNTKTPSKAARTSIWEAHEFFSKFISPYITGFFSSYVTNSDQYTKKFSIHSRFSTQIQVLQINIISSCFSASQRELREFIFSGRCTLSTSAGVRLKKEHSKKKEQKTQKKIEQVGEILY